MFVIVIVNSRFLQRPQKLLESAYSQGLIQRKIDLQRVRSRESGRQADSQTAMVDGVPRQFVYGHFVYDTSSTDISSTDISSTTVYHRVGQLYIQLLFQQIIIFINSNFYSHSDSLLSIPLPLTL